MPLSLEMSPCTATVTTIASTGVATTIPTSVVSKDEQRQGGFDLLPAELVCLIAIYLGEPGDVARFGSTCRRLMPIVREASRMAAVERRLCPLYEDRDACAHTLLNAIARDDPQTLFAALQTGWVRVDDHMDAERLWATRSPNDMVVIAYRHSRSMPVLHYIGSRSMCNARTITPLFVAAASGAVGCMRLLLALGATLGGEPVEHAISFILSTVAWQRVVRWHTDDPFCADALLSDRHVPAGTARSHTVSFHPMAHFESTPASRDENEIKNENEDRDRKRGQDRHRSSADQCLRTHADEGTWFDPLDVLGPLLGAIAGSVPWRINNDLYHPLATLYSTLCSSMGRHCPAERVHQSTLAVARLFLHHGYRPDDHIRSLARGRPPVRNPIVEPARGLDYWRRRLFPQRSQSVQPREKRRDGGGGRGDELEYVHAVDCDASVLRNMHGLRDLGLSTINAVTVDAILAFLALCLESVSSRGPRHKGIGTHEPHARQTVRPTEWSLVYLPRT